MAHIWSASRCTSVRRCCSSASCGPRAVVLARPGVQVSAARALAEAATFHRGHIWTPGRTYHLLDDRLYGELTEMRTIRLDEGARYVARALFSYVTVPLPGQIYSAAAL